MLDQGEQEDKNHVIWETSTKEQDDNKKKGTCFKPSSPPILAFKPPNPQDIRNKKTKEHMIKKTRGTRSKEQDD